MKSNVKRVSAAVAVTITVGGKVELGTSSPVVVDAWISGGDCDASLYSFNMLPAYVKARILDALIVEALDRQRAEDAQEAI